MNLKFQQIFLNLAIPTLSNLVNAKLPKKMVNCWSSLSITLSDLNVCSGGLVELTHELRLRMANAFVKQIKNIYLAARLEKTPAGGFRDFLNDFSLAVESAGGMLGWANRFGLWLPLKR